MRAGLFIDEDGAGDLSLWRENGLYPVQLLRKGDLPHGEARETVWALIEEAVEHG